MNAPTPPLAKPPLLNRGEREFTRVAVAFFVGGFAIFALLYSVQPILPMLSREFSVTPAVSALAVSATTLAMAFALVIAGSVSEVLGRKRIMVVALGAAGLATLLCAAAPTWGALIALRALTGLALSGLPAVAMAYLADEVAPPSLGFAMGLYISGSTLGGMLGRVEVAIVADHWGWRHAVAAIGVEGVLGAFYFIYALPRERMFEPKAPNFSALVRTLGGHFRDPGLRLLFAEGFLVMGAFVCAYNFCGFRLEAPPFSLSATVAGFVFLVYLVGAASSTVMGDLAGRFGRRRVLWTGSAVALIGAAVSVPDHFASLFLGLALLTWGFFGAHSISSSWVGLRAVEGRAQAAALYLLFYYLGSSVIGAAGGLFYQQWGWNGVVGLIAVLMTGALAVAWRLAYVPPPAHLMKP